MADALVTDYPTFVRTLADHEVAFVIIGGTALTLQGSATITKDLDICYERSNHNLARIEEALRPFKPRLRGVPADLHLPFALDASTLNAGLNFSLTTTHGDLDLLGEVAGLGSYQVVKRFAEIMSAYAREVHVLNLDGLERAKRAAGRLKDMMALAEIIELRRLRAGRNPPT